MTAEPARIKVREMFERWEKVRKFTRSWRLERARLEPFVRLAGHRWADEITPDAWSDLRSIRMYEASPRTGKRVSAATLDTELLRAKQMYRWAIVAGVLGNNPIAAAQGAGVRTARETWLTWEQVETLLHTARPNPFLHAGILVAVSTGLRISEMLTLRHDRIAGNGQLTINSAQTKSKRKRIVALTPRALEYVNALPRHGASPFVFWSKQTGRALHPSTIELWFRAAVEKCGLDAVCAFGDKRLRWHDLRHTHASLADAAGISLKSLRDQLGHADSRTTERYMHREQEDRALEIAAAMDRRPAKKAPATSESESTSKKLENYS
jgi:integrase